VNLKIARPGNTKFFQIIFDFTLRYVFASGIDLDLIAAIGTCIRRTPDSPKKQAKIFEEHASNTFPRSIGVETIGDAWDCS
jgi:hypothetical protein